MKISNENKKIIVNEFDKVLKLMKNTNNISEKLFYFSATYAMVLRILNIEYDPLLILIHSVLLSTYSNINSFANNIANKQNVFFSIPEKYFDKIENNLKDLSRSIDSNDEIKIYKDLQRFTVLAYLVTGNGNYLYKKGIINFN